LSAQLHGRDRQLCPPQVTSDEHQESPKADQNNGHSPSNRCPEVLLVRREVALRHIWLHIHAPTQKGTDPEEKPCPDEHQPASDHRRHSARSGR
jgi:hypothetical protein